MELNGESVNPDDGQGEDSLVAQLINFGRSACRTMKALDAEEWRVEKSIGEWRMSADHRKEKGLSCVTLTLRDTTAEYSYEAAHRFVIPAYLLRD